MNKRIRKFVLAIIILWFSLNWPNMAQAGFGISPSGLRITEALRGTSIEKSIVLSRNNPKEDLLIEAKLAGEIADWILLERGSRFTYPAGKKQFPVQVTINIPRTAANGDYQGKITFTGFPASACDESGCTGSSVGIATGAVADLRVSVTDKEIKSFRVLGIQVDKARANEKLGLILFLENNGNVDIQPDHIIVDIFDKFHKLQLGSFTVSRFEGKVKPQNSGTVKALIPWVPDKDNYWAEVAVFNHKNQLVAKENLAFETEAADTSSGAGAGSAEKEGNLTWLYILIGILGGGMIFLLLGFFFFRFYIKKHLELTLKFAQDQNKSQSDGAADQFENFSKVGQINLKENDVSTKKKRIFKRKKQSQKQA